MRRAGGARSNRRCIPCGKHLSALMRSLWEPACRRLGSKAAPAMARSALALTATSPMPLPLIYHEDYSPEFPAEHRFPMDKFRLQDFYLCSGNQLTASWLRWSPVRYQSDGNPNFSTETIAHSRISSISRGGNIRWVAQIWTISGSVLNASGWPAASRTV